MDIGLTYTDADGVITDLNDGTKFYATVLRGAGIPPVLHETVKTPTRDGETHVRAILEPRFLIAVIDVQGTDWAAHLANRRAIVRALNPKIGVGTLKWTPDATLYAIDCLVEQGVDFSRSRGGPRQTATISFRCPDPTWYDPTQKSTAFAITGGLEIPLKFNAGGGSDSMSISALAESQVINNTGDIATQPTITIPGPFTNPKLTNVTTGKLIAFSPLTVLAGETLVIDMDKQTAKVDGVSVMSKRTSDSEAWGLETGNNTVKFETSTGQATATVAYFIRFLGV